MSDELFDLDEMQKLLEQMDTSKIAKNFEEHETEEMKAAEKRYEDYILKHKNEE